jgi:hypothetical protein
MPNNAAPSAIVPQKTTGKIIYIDNLKVILITLVVLHHAFITYGAPGGWYYFQKTTSEIAKIPMTLFVAVNQSFFMGFFFFLSSFFIPSSYNKKGATRFIKDRLIRLGIPLIFYSLLLGPVMNYLVYYFGNDHDVSFLNYLSGYDDWIDFGVLWFVAALLLFTLLYVFWRAIFKNQTPKKYTAPDSGRILAFAAGLGILSFLVRIIFPIGWILKPVGFQLGHFPQYVVMFIIGLIASQNNWLDQLSYRQGKNMALIAAGIVIVIFPLFYVLLTWLKFPPGYFSGGLHWPSLLYAMWEQMAGITIMTALLCIGKQRLNKSSALQSKLSRSAFAVYIFHPLVLISLSLLVSPWNIEPEIKLLLIGPLAVVSSFFLASVIVQIPGVKKII